MSAAELLYGQCPPSAVALGDAELDLAASDTVVLHNAEIFYSLFEIRMAVAEARLPVSLHPSIPALLGITFIHADDGPLGAFNLAYLGIACRTGIKPRHFIHSSFCDSATAGKFFRARYGFSCRAASVDSHETYDRVHGSITLDERALLDLSISNCIPLVGAGATIKYSPPLNAVRLGGNAVAVQFEAAYEFKRVLRGKPDAALYVADALGHASVVPTHAIAGSHAVLDLHLMPVRFEVDLATPAESGGARKIKR